MVLISTGLLHSARIEIKKRLASLAYQKFNNAPAGEGGEYSGDSDVDLSKFSFENGEVTQGKNKVSFKELVGMAYMNRISLGERAHYKTPEIHFDPETGKGRPFLYFTNGVVCSEVSIDKYTGDMKILRTDIVMDLGRRINDGIDYGQVAEPLFNPLAG